MRFKNIYFLFGIVFIWISQTSNFGGLSSFQNCANCHSGAAYTTTVDSIVIRELTSNATVTKYQPGSQYSLWLYGKNSSTNNKFGFQMTTNGKGSLSEPPIGTQLNGSIWQHNSRYNSSAGSRLQLNLKWTAPAKGTGTVSFQSYINSVNGDSATTNDKSSDLYTAQIPEDTAKGDSAAVFIRVVVGSEQITKGELVIFRATPINGGTPTYQWKLNSTNVGTNSDTFSSTTLTNGVFITCVMTSSLPNLRNNPARSNQILMTVKGSGGGGGGTGTVSILSHSINQVEIVPNGQPSAYKFAHFPSLNASYTLQVLNSRGQIFTSKIWDPISKSFSFREMPDGMYFIRLKMNNLEKTFKLIKQ